MTALEDALVKCDTTRVMMKLMKMTFYGTIIMKNEILEGFFLYELMDSTYANALFLTSSISFSVPWSFSYANHFLKKNFIFLEECFMLVTRWNNRL